MKKVAAGSEIYKFGTDTCFGVGISWSNKDLDDALEHRVYDLLSKVKRQETIREEMLNDATGTDYQRKNLNETLSDAYDDDDAVENWEVGEVLAEAYLTDHRNCYFPWPIRDDKRHPKASLPGVDLVGLKTDDRGDVFAFGEVKTSTDSKYPPGVIKSLKEQLKNLRDCKKLRDNLIFSYLYTRAKNSQWFKRYRMAVTRYLRSKTDIHLYGIVIRDVTPCEADLQSCVEKLNDGCPEDTQIELLTLNLPKGRIKDLTTTLVEKGAGDKTMSLLDKIKNHWAIIAVGGEESIDRADRLVNERRFKHAVGEQISFNFSVDEQTEQSLEQIALAYKMAAVEVLDKFNNPSKNRVLYDQTISACYKVFGIKSLETIPVETNERLFFILELSAMAYCGDRGSDIKRWYKENGDAISVPNMEDNVSWDCRILYRLFDCWIRLFRKNGWKDLHDIPGIIQKLRNEQKLFEKEYLNDESPRANRRNAIRLISLYHWSKATEILALYMLQGESDDPFTELDKHFNFAIRAAERSDIDLESLLWWLRAAARVMVTNSLWWAIQKVKDQMSEFVKSLIKREHQPMFELLPPQRAALVEQGFFDPAKTAIVVDMPTSGGKTLLAQFKIIQALNQLENGWVAYVAPTRALVAQITRRLRKDFRPIKLQVEQLTPAVEIDQFDEALFDEALFTENQEPFHILVTTPEKLSLVIRNKKIMRPLALVVMDEAHNISNEERGLRIELLLATIKYDYEDAKFLLLKPFFENVDVDMLVRWLAQDINTGQSISIGTTPWKPNERIIGIYRAIKDNSKCSGCRLEFEVLTTIPKAMQFREKCLIGEVISGEKEENNLYKIFKKSDDFSNSSSQTAAIASILSSLGTSIAIGSQIKIAESMAKKAEQVLPNYEDVPQEIKLVQNFLRSEMSSDEDLDKDKEIHRLIKLLDKGIGVHHAGLPEEVRSLMEWLAENKHLKLLCATTTLAQGLNFPVSSIFLQSYEHYSERKGKMNPLNPHDFWNLVGRVGRVGQDSIGIIGLAKGKCKKGELVDFLRKNIGDLVSRLERLIDQLQEVGEQLKLIDISQKEQWEDFRCYVAHLCAEKKRLGESVTDEDTEHLLQQTYGYTRLRNDQDKKANILFDVTRNYVNLLEGPHYAELVELAELTGLTPEGVERAVEEIDRLELKPSDWFPEELFSNKDNSKMEDLFSIMLKVDQLKKHLEKVHTNESLKKLLADITCDWVNGESIVSITKKYFKDLDKACQTLHREIMNNATWGISALSNIFMKRTAAPISDEDRLKINALPAMIYYGVNTEDGVLMRMNAVPRSIAKTLGEYYRKHESSNNRFSVRSVRKFLKNLKNDEWEKLVDQKDKLSGQNYQKVCYVLLGESDYVGTAS